MTAKELKRLDYLYKYCMKARSRGQLYKERLKELQQITLKKLIKEIKNVDDNENEKEKVFSRRF